MCSREMGQTENTCFLFVWIGMDVRGKERTGEGSEDEESGGKTVKRRGHEREGKEMRGNESKAGERKGMGRKGRKWERGKRKVKERKEKGRRGHIACDLPDACSVAS